MLFVQTGLYEKCLTLLHAQTHTPLEITCGRQRIEAAISDKLTMMALAHLLQKLVVAQRKECVFFPTVLHIVNTYSKTACSKYMKVKYPLLFG